jgi:spore germination cell wall hydrolase CwlJ-like protein
MLNALYLSYCEGRGLKSPKSVEEGLVTLIRDRHRSDGPARRTAYRHSDGPGVFRRMLEYTPYVCGGAMLVVAFAFAGHQLGQNAVASSLPSDSKWTAPVSPASALITKGSLLPEASELDLGNLPLLKEEAALADAKGDYAVEDPVEEAPAPKVAMLAPQPQIPEAKKPEAEPKRLAMSPPVWKLESTFKLKKVEKQKVVAQRRVRLAEQNCLARAIYFEARSETELGQLAVAKVILNRVKDPEYPKSICGVVYQGANRARSCQFSFACDGQPDDPHNPEAWDRASRVAQKALDGDQTVKIMGAATHYHADYVRPRWSRHMKRLIKIGRHIFYADS